MGKKFLLLVRAKLTEKVLFSLSHPHLSRLIVLVPTEPWPETGVIGGTLWHSWHPAPGLPHIRPHRWHSVSCQLLSAHLGTGFSPVLCLGGRNLATSPYCYRTVDGRLPQFLHQYWMIRTQYLETAPTSTFSLLNVPASIYKCFKWVLPSYRYWDAKSQHFVETPI